jgi:hypothetical protein
VPRSEAVELFRRPGEFAVGHSAKIRRGLGSIKFAGCAAHCLSYSEPVGGPIRVQARFSGLTVHPVDRLAHVCGRICSIGGRVGECRLPQPSHLGFNVLLSQQPRTRVRKLQRELGLILTPLLNVARNAGSPDRAGWLVISRCLPSLPEPGVLGGFT